MLRKDAVHHISASAMEEAIAGLEKMRNHAKKHHDYISSYADNLASTLQGSVPTFASPNEGVPAEGQQEGKRWQARSSYEAEPDDYVTRQLKSIQRMTETHQQRYGRSVTLAQQEVSRLTW